MIAFLLTPIGRGLAIILVAVASFGIWLIGHDSKVARNAVNNERNIVRKANDKAVSTADRARASSRDNGVRGVRDPNTVD